MLNPFVTTSEATLDDTTYRIDPGPAHLALIVIGVLVALFAALLFTARRKPGALAHPWALACVTPHVTFAVFLIVTKESPLSWLLGDDVSSHVASRMFRSTLHLYGVAAALSASFFVVTCLVLALREGSRRPLLPLAAPLVVLAALAGTRFAVHATELEAVGALPFYVAGGQTKLHVGRDREVPVTLSRPPGRAWLFWSESGPQPLDGVVASRWSPVPSVHVHAAARGKVPFDAVAHRGPVTLATHLSLEAVAERASPLLSLRVGDRMTYRVRARSSDGAVLYFISLSGHESVHEVDVEVTETRERGGFRTFVLAVRRAERVDEVEVVAIEGQTLAYYAAQDRIGSPVVSFEEGTPAYGSGAVDPVPCSFALLDAGHALCQRGGRTADVPAPPLPPSPAPGRKGATLATRAGGTKDDRVGRPPVAFAAAAPLTFARDTSNTTGTIATVFVAIVTIGLVILPDGSSTSSYTLVSTVRGAEGAPEALPY